jgi:hypothetical protein
MTFCGVKDIALGEVLEMRNPGLEAKLVPPRDKHQIYILISRGSHEGGLPPPYINLTICVCAWRFLFSCGCGDPPPTSLIVGVLPYSGIAPAMCKVLPQCGVLPHWLSTPTLGKHPHIVGVLPHFKVNTPSLIYLMVQTWNSCLFEFVNYIPCWLLTAPP